MARLLNAALEDVIAVPRAKARSYGVHGGGGICADCGCRNVVVADAVV